MHVPSSKETMRFFKCKLWFGECTLHEYCQLSFCQSFKDGMVLLHVSLPLDIDTYYTHVAKIVGNDH